MNSKKELKRSKAILLAIDLVLLAVAIVIGVYCARWIVRIAEVSNTGYEERMQALDERELQINSKLDELRPQIEEMENQSALALESAKAERSHAEQELQAAIAQCDAVQQQVDETQGKLDAYASMEQKIADLRVEYGLACRRLEDKIIAGESDVRICYLTFDDGPSYTTPDFLKELDRLDVKATFFTIGIGVPEKESYLRDASLKQQALRGHNIANHTYTHAFNGALYKSVDNFIAAVKQQEDVVYNATGIYTDIVRFPAGSYYCYYRTSSIAALKEMGYEWIDWLGNAYDSGNTKRSSASIANAVIYQASQVDIYVGLMHDWNSNTLKALDKIVTNLREQGFVFLPLFKESITMGDYTVPRWDD